ncbi:MAG: hypothetical protein H0U48_08235, partial [Euzebyaceae bacterium]|nr:hypothetical protein [Euzebyaceae bacterium]
MPTTTDSSSSSGQGDPRFSGSPSGPDDPCFSGSPPVAVDLRTWAVWHLRAQAVACARLGSPLYAELLGRVADDVQAEGPA